jgi:ABC-type glycerol-3-phosphate transport system substrate-binding protein
MPGGVVDTSTVQIGGGDYGTHISSKSWKDPDKRWYLSKMINWLTSDEMQVFMHKSGAIVPLKKGVVASLDRSSMTPNEEFLAKVLEHSDAHEQIILSHYQSWPDSIDAWNYAQNEIDVLFAGGETAEEWIQKVQKALDEAKSER